MAAAAMAVFSAAVWTGSYSSAPVVVSASGFTLSGVTAAGDLLSFQQASVPEAGLNGIYMDTELSRGSLSQKTARILGANQTQAGKIEIWTTNIDGPGEPCRTNLDLEPDPPGQSLDLRLSAPPSDKPVFVLGVLSGNIRISQLTTARDAAESGNPGCAKQVTAAARTYLVSQAPLALIAPAPAEARFQFRSDRPIRDPFPVFSLSGLRARQVSSDGSRWPRGLWLGRDAIHLDRVAVFQGRIELTMRSTVSGWLWPLLCCGNLVLLFLSYRFNGLPVPGLRYG